MDFEWPPFEWFYYELAHIFTILFLILIMKPLLTLTKGRSVLMIVFSKAILSLIDAVFTFLARTANRITNNFFLETTLFVWRLRKKLMHDMLGIAILLHILALAVNRVHCILWPLHYKGWITKRKVVVQCILLWILGILFATVFSVLELPNNVYQSCACSLLAIMLYLIVGAKLVWKKYNSQSTIHPMVEKDFNKISIVCVNSLIPILISYVAQAIALANLENKVLASSMQMVQTITGPFVYCADELCLMILLAEFRRIIKEFMRIITCRKNNNSNQNSRIVAVIPVSVVSSAVAMNKQTN